MKKFCITLEIIAIILLTIACGSGTGNTESEAFLRIHIRANSNGDTDQAVKYIVKDAIVNYLTPVVADCRTKSEAVEKISAKTQNMKFFADETLKADGFEYSSEVSVRSEYFPTRIYGDTVLNSGYYDAVIINLGSGKGDNWWCVVYPPLCFSSGKNVKYRSKIIEIIEEFRRKTGR